jgi:hypothetical protein
MWIIKKSASRSRHHSLIVGYWEYINILQEILLVKLNKYFRFA